MNKPKWLRAEDERKQLESSMNHFDFNEYLISGQFPQEMPESLKQYTERILAANNAKNASQLIEQQYQYSALQSQINPHFLYNTLECIRSEALAAQHDTIAEMTEKLSRFFRYCISSQDDFVTLRDEISNLKDYFFIQQYRFGNRFSLEILLDDDKVLESYLPKMTLQPLAENAIYHGLELKKGAGSLCLRTAHTDKKLYIWLYDNGVGMTETQVNNLNTKIKHPLNSTSITRCNKGLALPNINSRIQLYFGKDYGIRVSSLPQVGTEIELLLPFWDTIKITNDKPFSKEEDML